MVHGLAVQLGGLLELLSEVGKGTTATLWLPTATKSLPVEESAVLQVIPGRTATILVVDDDPLIAMSTVDMLEDLGHTAIEANSAQRALEILEAGQAVDLMMTDQAMPGMTGVELAEIVHRERHNMPILLATGYADLPTAQQSNLPRLSKVPAAGPDVVPCSCAMAHALQMASKRGESFKSDLAVMACTPLIAV
jgi:CheY-like chemotaxis protein